MRSFYAELWPMAVNFCIKETLKLVKFTWNAIASRAQYGLPSIARYARLLHYNLLLEGNAPTRPNELCNWLTLRST